MYKKKRQLPDLIVLDLNLPGMNGRQILAEMTAHPELHKIPVCIFTGAAQEESVIEEHPPLRLCFYAKVDSFRKLLDTVKSFLKVAANTSV